MCFRPVFIIYILWIRYGCKQAIGCTSTSSVHARQGDSVTIQFQAKMFNSQGSSFSVINQILSPSDKPLLTALYTNGVLTKLFPCSNCTFTGNTATGDLSIRLDNIQTSGGGTYKHTVKETSSEVKGCVVLYIIGKPTKPSITINKVSFEGESVTLTCSSTSITTPRDPNLRMMYNWKVDNNTPSDTRYTFSDTRNQLTISNVGKNDANKLFTCTAKEDVSNAVISTNSEPRKIVVYYKPDNGPLIQGFNNNSQFDAILNRQQTLTCSVIGGYPVPSLSWSCFTGAGQNLSSGRNVSKTWTWTATSRGTCKCTSIQSGSADTFTLDVRILSPPSSPTFSLYSQSVRPSSTVKIIRDSNESITCSATSFPPPSYKWTYNNGQLTEVSQEATLNPSQVTKDGSYYCNVHNTMAPSKGNQETGTNSAFIDIQQLYAPTVKPFNIEPLVEGSLLSVKCNAEPGNPTETAFSWKRKLNSSSMTSWQDIPDSSINGGQLDKSNINRNDTGIYKCTASNEMKPTAENKQIGSTFQTFLLNVLYPASIFSFVIEGHARKPVVILDENDDQIHFICEVHGNPNSTVKISFKNDVKKEALYVNKLLLVYDSVSCLDSGEYTCEGSNGIGQPSRKQIQLYVNCSPRPLYRINENISSVLSTEVTLSFTALAYPNPSAKGFFWYKRNVVNWTQVLANRDLRITSTALQTNLTILNTTKTDFGQYKLIIKNEFGTYIQHFYLAEIKAEKGKCNSDALGNLNETNNNTLIVGIVLGSIIAVLIGCVAVMVILYRRKSYSKGSESGDQLPKQRKYMDPSCDAKTIELQQNKIESAHNTPDEDKRQYMDLSEYSRDDKSTYDILHKHHN